MLYLGAASGTTVSHLSDIIAEGGRAYCVEISSRPFRDFLLLCKRRPNLVPILADASQPEVYRPLVEKVDLVYQDIAQPEQADILLKNVGMFLKQAGHALIALKARSIDVTKDPREVFQEEMEKLEQKLEVLDAKILDPYEKDHAMVLLRASE